VSSAAANPQHQLSAALEALLELRGVAKRFGAREVLKNIFVKHCFGRIPHVARRSGSGKTTVLRLVAGFERPSAGEIWMSGQRLDTLTTLQTPREHRCSSTTRYSRILSVRENVAYGLRVQKTPQRRSAAASMKRCRNGEDAGIRGFASVPS